MRKNGDRKWGTKNPYSKSGDVKRIKTKNKKNERAKRTVYG